MGDGGIPYPGIRTVKTLNHPLIQDWIAQRGQKRKGEQMTAINHIEIIILVGIWFALNLSMIRDWIAQRGRDGEVI
jgi:hypothetical protein